MAMITGHSYARPLFPGSTFALTVPDNADIDAGLPSAAHTANPKIESSPTV
jgi:hypothetical protein